MSHTKFDWPNHHTDLTGQGQGQCHHIKVVLYESEVVFLHEFSKRLVVGLFGPSVLHHTGRKVDTWSCTAYSGRVIRGCYKRADGGQWVGVREWG